MSGGLLVFDDVRPANGTYSVQDIYLQGGLQSLASESAIGGIVAANLKVGMFCFSRATNILYLLTSLTPGNGFANGFFSVFAAPSVATSFTSVATVATANVTLSGEQTINGVTTSASRVLVTGQTDPTTNGIYVSGSGAWTRSSDANSSGAFIPGEQVTVGTGSSTYTGTTWTYNGASSPTLGTTPISFAENFATSLGSGSGGGTTWIPSAPTSDGYYLLNRASGTYSWVAATVVPDGATAVTVGTPFNPTITLASGGSGLMEAGSSWTPTFTTSPLASVAGVSSFTIRDSNGNSVGHSDGGPYAAPISGGTYNTTNTPGFLAPNYSVGVYANMTRYGLNRNTGTIYGTSAQKVWYGVGTAGATGFNGSTGALVGATGTLTGTLQNSGVLAFNASPATQKVYYACDVYYGTRTFKDANGFTFAMNAPTTVSVTNSQGLARNFYLYESQFTLSSVTNPITPA